MYDLLHDSQNRSMQQRLSLDEKAATKFLKFQSELNGVVGMKPLKEFVRQRIADAVGRKLLKEEDTVRHLLVVGALGTGKDKAASAVVDLLKITGALRQSKHGVPESGKVESQTAYLIVLAKWTDADEEKSELLDEILTKKSMAVLMGPEKDVMHTAGGLDCFKKQAPWTVALPIMTPHVLAQITFNMVQERGYVLRRSDAASDEMNLRTMEFIVRQTHDT